MARKYYKRRNKRRSYGGSLRSAWKKKNRKKRGSVVLRQVKSNMKKIRTLAKAPELKFANEQPCTVRTNWCGHILQAQKVDNYGMPHDSTDWVAAPGGLPVSAWCNLIQRPCQVQQANNVPLGVTGNGAPVGESERIGNTVSMYNLVAKLTMVCQPASANGGIFANVPMRQKITALFVLDTEPCRENPTLNTNAPSFNPSYIPGNLYVPIPSNEINNQFASATPQVFQSPYYDDLRSLPAPGLNPPGPNTGTVGDKDLFGLSYYSKDHVGANDRRFKVLKKVTLYAQQLPPEPPSFTTGSQSRTTATKTVTIKAPYRMLFESDIRLLPSNKEILIFYWSDTPTIQATGGTAPVNYVAAPMITSVCRFQFRDS